MSSLKNDRVKEAVVTALRRLSSRCLGDDATVEKFIGLPVIPSSESLVTDSYKGKDRGKLTTQAASMKHLRYIIHEIATEALTERHRLDLLQQGIYPYIINVVLRSSKLSVACPDISYVSLIALIRLTVNCPIVFRDSHLSENWLASSNLQNSTTDDAIPITNESLNLLVTTAETLLYSPYGTDPAWCLAVAIIIIYVSNRFYALNSTASNNAFHRRITQIINVLKKLIKNSSDDVRATFVYQIKQKLKGKKKKSNPLETVQVGSNGRKGGGAVLPTMSPRRLAINTDAVSSDDDDDKVVDTVKKSKTMNSVLDDLQSTRKIEDNSGSDSDLVDKKIAVSTVLRNSKTFASVMNDSDSDSDDETTGIQAQTKTSSSNMQCKCGNKTGRSVFLAPFGSTFNRSPSNSNLEDSDGSDSDSDSDGEVPLGSLQYRLGDLGVRNGNGMNQLHSTVVHTIFNLSRASDGFRAAGDKAIQQEIIGHSIVILFTLLTRQHHSSSSHMSPALVTLIWATIYDILSRNYNVGHVLFEANGGVDHLIDSAQRYWDNEFQLNSISYLENINSYLVLVMWMCAKDRSTSGTRFMSISACVAVVLDCSVRHLRSSVIAECCCGLLVFYGLIIRQQSSIDALIFKLNPLISPSKSSQMSPQSTNRSTAIDVHVTDMHLRKGSIHSLIWILSQYPTIFSIQCEGLTALVNVSARSEEREWIIASPIAVINHVCSIIETAQVGHIFYSASSRGILTSNDNIAGDDGDDIDSNSDHHDSPGRVILYPFGNIVHGQPKRMQDSTLLKTIDSSSPKRKIRIVLSHDMYFSLQHIACSLLRNLCLTENGRRQMIKISLTSSLETIYRSSSPAPPFSPSFITSSSLSGLQDIIKLIRKHFRAGLDDLDNVSSNFTGDSVGDGPEVRLPHVSVNAGTVLLSSLGVLRNVCLDTLVRQLFQVSYAGSDMLLSLFDLYAKNGSVEYITVVCWIIRNYLFDATIMEEMLTMGNGSLVSRVLDLLVVRGDSEACVDAVCHILWLISQTYDKNGYGVALIIDHGGLCILLSTLTRHSSYRYIQEAGCACLMNITADRSYVDDVVSLNGVQIILSAMETFPTSEIVQETSLGALMNICLIDQYKIYLNDINGLPIIITAIRTYVGLSHKVIEQGTGTLRSLSVEEYNRFMLTELGVIPLLAQCLEYHGDYGCIRERALCTLHHLKAHNGWSVSLY